MPYLPVMQGQVSGAPNGSSVRVLIRPQLDEVAVLAFLIVFLPYVGFQIYWTALVLGLLHCVGVGLSILPAVRWAESLSAQLGT